MKIAERKNKHKNIVQSFNADWPEIHDGGYVVLDMGKESVGGYTVFEVTRYTGSPKVRVSFSDRKSTFDKEVFMSIGDFTRGCCTYLGIELPVSPGNPYRYEDYTINRCGKYIYPMIQGHQRFVAISVEGGDVCFRNFYILNNGDCSSLEGYFKSDDEALNGLWNASARTISLATVRSDQFEMVEGRIALRKLTKRPGCVFLKSIYKDNIFLDCDFELSLNPKQETGISFVFFANDESDGYKLVINKSGYIALEGLCHIKLPELMDNHPYNLQVFFCNTGADILLDRTKIMSYSGKINASGRFGISMEDEWRGMIDDIRITSANSNYYNISMGLENFEMYSSGYFISDGAKRDRIPWSGDLDWAFDCGWYAFGNKMHALNTLDILGFHTNPEGYIFAACYPENNIPPREGEYGYYQSDMFAAWYVVSALTYGKLAGYEHIYKYFGKMKDCLNYLWKYVDEEDGLFYQRYETSKGLWDHVLGDTGKNTYTNLIIYDAMKNFSEYAFAMGHPSSGEEFKAKAEIMRKGIFDNLYSKELKGFIKRKDLPELCNLSNPFAMAKGLVSTSQAEEIKSKALEITQGHGKIVLLMVRGLYRYGFVNRARELLYGKFPYRDTAGNVCCYVDWMSAVDNPDLPETVYECMHNPPQDFGTNLNWGDLCHPDCGVCGIISGFIAGIIPEEEGFKSILLCPAPEGVESIKCKVPVFGGYAEVSIKTDEEGSAVKLSVPQKVKVRTDFSYLPQPVKYSLKRK